MHLHLAIKTFPSIQQVFLFDLNVGSARAVATAMSETFGKSLTIEVTGTA